MGARDLYYHCQYSDHSRATVCLVTVDGTVIARGVALCSPKDVFLKAKGRAIALGRALKATHHMADVLLLNTLKHEALGSAIMLGYNYKGEYMPDLTAYEAVLVERVCAPVPV